jgi:acyl-[acyl-carrier-protein]-phospholipid O-acyltransferase/long-chain-fatty-acid--[acyl-carrier-protein] ligase
MTTTRISEWVIRSVVRLVARSLFRVRILGKEHIPSPGPALLVPNHLTYFDGFLIGSCLDRVARFLVWKPYYDHKLLGWGFRLAKAIPIWTKPHGGAQAIQRARKALDQGHVVCIFAEGSISRNGDLLPFQRGLEAIVRGLDVPVIPVHLGGLWGSLFSLNGDGFSWKHVRTLRQPAVISFGVPMPPSSKAHEVRQAVQQLGAGGRKPKPYGVTSSTVLPIAGPDVAPDATP